MVPPRLLRRRDAARLRDEPLADTFHYVRRTFVALSCLLLPVLLLLAVLAIYVGSLMLTAVFTALVVWIVGLAVPVTASYIICAVITAPALIKLGVPDFAAHMFIFYFGMMSFITPPVAIAAKSWRNCIANAAG